MTCNLSHPIGLGHPVPSRTYIEIYICIYTCTDLKRNFISVSSIVKGLLNLHKTSFVENKLLGHMYIYINMYMYQFWEKNSLKCTSKKNKNYWIGTDLVCVAIGVCSPCLFKSSVCCSGCVCWRSECVAVGVCLFNPVCVAMGVCLFKSSVCCSMCVFSSVVAVGVCLFKSSVCRSGCVFVQVQCVLQWVCFFKFVST